MAMNMIEGSRCGEGTFRSTKVSSRSVVGAIGLDVSISVCYGRLSFGIILFSLDN